MQYQHAPLMILEFFWATHVLLSSQKQGQVYLSQFPDLQDILYITLHNFQVRGAQRRKNEMQRYHICIHSPPHYLDLGDEMHGTLRTVAPLGSRILVGQSIS
jgi:hypothetical protein